MTVSASLALGFTAPERSEGTNVLLIVLSGAVLLLGATLRERAEAQRRLAEQEHISEAERARRTLLEERARIARELHDVVAHHMSVITVQADSAPYRIAEMPQEAREEFGSIAAAARESLTEMRRLLGVLRSETTRGERAPQPGLERLEQLVEATVRAGVPTELDLALPGAENGPEAGDGAGRGDGAGAAGADAPAPTVTLSAYRIVQEALANVVRHAPGARTRVSVTVPDEDWLSVVVVNGASPEPEAAPLETTGTGHGLVGMRERVRLVGGSLQVGALPDGGFRVAARLPLHPPPRPLRPDRTTRPLPGPTCGTRSGTGPASTHPTRGTPAPPRPYDPTVWKALPRMNGIGTSGVPPTGRVTRLVIVDDQAMVRAGFAALLAAQSDIDVVGEAPDGAAGVELCRRVHPDVVLMDVRMPRLDGLEAAEQLLDPPPPGVTHRPKVLMLTTFDVDDYVYEALRLGASGFLLKDAPPADLIAAVRVVAEGEALLAPSVTRRLIAEFARQRAGNGPLRGRAPRRPDYGSRHSPNGRPRCWSSWPADGPTPRSPRSSCWPSRR